MKKSRASETFASQEGAGGGEVCNLLLREGRAVGTLNLQSVLCEWGSLPYRGLGRYVFAASRMQTRIGNACDANLHARRDNSINPLFLIRTTSYLWFAE